MDNDFQKKNEQVNDTNTNPPVEQNNDIENNTNTSNDNQQMSYNTYSALPGIFNNQNTVSQNRNIPPENRPVNRPINRPPVNRNNPPLRQPNPNNPVPNQQANNRSGVSEGRAFAQEFYSQSNPNQPMGNQQRPPMNGQGRPYQPMGNERPPMNGQGRPYQPMGNERPPMNGQGRPYQPMGNERPQMNGQGRPYQPMGNERPQVNGQGRPYQPMGNERPQVSGQDRPQPFTVEEKTNINAQDKPQQSVFNEESKVNYTQNVESASASTEPNSRPKRDVKYNYSELTPPNKKSTSIIILVYIIVVVLLLGGIIALFSSKETSETQDEFKEFFQNIGLDEIFSNDSDDDYSKDVFGEIDSVDEGYVEDLFGELDSIDEDYSEELFEDIDDDYSMPKTLKYSSGNSNFEMIIYTPIGYELREEEETSCAIFDSYDRTITCEAELLEGYSSRDDASLKDLMDFSGKSYISAEEIAGYQTRDGNAYIWQVEYDNRIETYAFIDVDSDMMLSVYMRKHNLAGDISKDNCLTEMEKFLDDMLQ